MIVTPTIERTGLNWFNPRATRKVYNCIKLNFRPISYNLHWFPKYLLAIWAISINYAKICRLMVRPASVSRSLVHNCHIIISPCARSFSLTTFTCGLTKYVVLDRNVRHSVQFAWLWFDGCVGSGLCLNYQMLVRLVVRKNGLRGTRCKSPPQPTQLRRAHKTASFADSVNSLISSHRNRNYSYNS